MTQPKQELEGYRLSPIQHRLWQLGYCGSSREPVAFGTVLIPGAVERGRLERAIQRVVARHEALRSSVQTLAGLATPLQVVDEPGDGFGRLAVKIGDGWLRLAAPMTVIDAASMALVIEEIAADYSADGLASAGSAADPLQYADVSEWMSELADAPDAEAERHYWRQFGSDLHACTGVHRNEGGNREESSLGAELDSKTVEAIRVGAGSGDWSVEGFLAVAWTTLLRSWRLSTCDTIGVLCDGRSSGELSRCVGPLTRAVPVAVPFDPGLSVRLAATRMSEALCKADAHSPCFSWDLYPEFQAASESRYFLHGFGYTKLPEAASDGALFSLRDIEASPDRFDVWLDCVADAGSIRLRLRWNPEKYSSELMGTLLSGVKTLAGSMSVNASHPLACASALDASVALQVKEQFNRTAVLFEGSCHLLHERFERQASKTAQAEAVRFEGLSVTYEDLNKRADAVASRLRDVAIGPECVVGICLDPSIDLVAAMLGVLKAGAAYMPLDPSYPEARLRFMLADSGARMVVGGSEVTEKLGIRGSQLLDVATLGVTENGEQRHDSMISRAWPDSPAYIIYTSGSTGQPKGAAISHRAICNHMSWMERTFPLSAGDRVVQKTPSSFDASIWEFYAPLLSGNSLVLAKGGGHRDAAYLVELLERERITVLQLVPSQLQMLLAEPGLSACRNLRRLFCGGEALTPELVARVMDVLPAIRVINLYGPTEATIDSTFYEWVPEPGGRTVPIGVPIANMRAYVVDERGELAGIGVEGELYLGGPGLARGYWGRAEATAERFVPDRWSGEAGARLYRSGDRVRWRGDGRLEYLGRKDEQVKIRGYRIEPGEVEAVLQQQAGVRQAAVVVREDRAGEKRLVGYVTGTGMGDLRRELGKRLPEYLVPVAIVEMEELPLTANGKLDRKALPEPEMGSGRGYVGPRNAGEEILCGIWGELLGVERVGVEDNFFELGGDSILSIQVIARARRAGVELTARQLFENPTVGALAAVARSSGEGKQEREEEKEGSEGPLTPIQSWFFEQEMEGWRHWNQSVLLEVSEKVEAGQIEEVLGKVREQHEGLRTRFERSGGEWRARVMGRGEGGGWKLQRIEVGGAEELEAVAEGVQRSLDPEQGKVAAAALAESGGGRRWLLLVVHHLVVDGVSWRVLLEDLERGSRQRASGGEVELGGKTASFVRWAGELKKYGEREEIAGELEYWERQLAGAGWGESGSEGNVEGSARVVEVEWTAERTRKLMQAAGGYRASVEEVLLTAVVAGVRRWRGGERLVVDMEGHGREEVVEGVDVTRTVGWFTAMYPVGLELRGEREAGGKVKRVKEQLRAVPGKGLGYGLLRYGDGVGRERLGRMAGPGVSFNYLGQWDGVWGRGERQYRASGESTGRGRDERAKRGHVLEFDAEVQDGCLRGHWIYSENLHGRESIEELARGFAAELDELMDRSGDPAAQSSLTLSDFPLLQSSQQRLDEALSGAEFEGFCD